MESEEDVRKEIEMKKKTNIDDVHFLNFELKRIISHRAQ